MIQPPIIDKLVSTSVQTKSGKYVIAKPLEFYGPYRYVIRLYHAFLILFGRARAVKFDC